MLFIHQTTCISPQQTFPEKDINLEYLYESSDNKLKARDPGYENIPANQLRKMGKSVRLGMGAALPLIPKDPKGIIIGTANAGMEESIEFMKQIIDHNEGILSPGTFVQSTPNTIASQISLYSGNKGYNITHVHAGMAFENALLDTAMLIKENPLNTYLVGGVDEIGTKNHNIDRLQSWYKKELVSNIHLYEADSPGSIAGEGAAMFLVNGNKTNAMARFKALTTLYSEDEDIVAGRMQWFLDDQLRTGENIDLLLTGENGDDRLLKFFSACESIMDNETTVARFKHMCGEYPTASSFALWIACQVLTNQALPQHMIKKGSIKKEYKNLLIYNNYKGMQHSFMLVSKIS